MTDRPGPTAAARDRLPVAPTTLGYVAAAVLAAALPLVLGDFGLYLAATIATAAIYGVAYDLAYGYTGLLSFGHAVFFGTGAYAAAFAVRDVGAGGLAAILLGVVAGTLAALLLGAVAVRVPEHGFVILTIIFVLLANLVAVAFSSVTGGTDGFTVAFPRLLGALDPFDPALRYYVVLGALAATLLLLRRLVASPVGLAFRMIDDNERRARLLGYDTARYKLAALAVSGGFSGLAGGLDAMVVGYVSAANYSVAASADPLVFTLVGGRGTLIGPVVGAAVVEGFAEGVRGLSTVYPLLVGTLLVLVVVAEREGILGVVARLRDRYRRRRGPGGSDDARGGRGGSGDAAEPDSGREVDDRTS